MLWTKKDPVENHIENHDIVRKSRFQNGNTKYHHHDYSTLHYVLKCFHLHQSNFHLIIQE